MAEHVNFIEWRVHPFRSDRWLETYFSPQGGHDATARCQEANSQEPELAWTTSVESVSVDLDSKDVVVTGDTLDLASEKVLLTVATQRNTCCHAGGTMTFDSAGNLYLATGDNTNPFATGYAVETAGAKALATGSHPVADAAGWADSQGVPGHPVNVRHAPQQDDEEDGHVGSSCPVRAIPTPAGRGTRGAPRASAAARARPSRCGGRNRRDAVRAG